MTARQSSIEVPAIVAGDAAPATAAVGCAANLPMALPQLVHRLSFDEFVILEVKDAGLAPWGVQFGLTRAEIEALADRLQQLLTKVDAGEQPLF